METTFFVMAPDTNHTSRIVFGGKVMAEMDKVAFCAVLRFLADKGSECKEAVTFKVEELTFNCPAYLGDIVYLSAFVAPTTGSKSIVVNVKGHVWRKEDDAMLPFASAKFVFVSLKDGKPHPH